MPEIAENQVSSMFNIRSGVNQLQKDAYSFSHTGDATSFVEPGTGSCAPFRNTLEHDPNEWPNINVKL